MRLATLKDGTRDGQLVIVSHDGLRYLPANAPWRTLQGALDAWADAEPALRELASRLDGDVQAGRSLSVPALAAPLPRAYEWVDGSAYINHIVLVRKARGAEPPEGLETEPLVYQGGSGVMLGPHDDIALHDQGWGLDYEAELCVILGDTPLGTTRGDAADKVRLLCLCNDVSLRNLIPGELKKGFGFFNSKPATAFSPFAITPDELGEAWRGGRVHLRLQSWINGTLSGDTDAGPEMHFSFFELIEHICKTRRFVAGTILGSGTVSNKDPARGVSCLAERRMREIISDGAARTPFLKTGDRVEIDMLDGNGRSLFGRIDQRVSAE